MPDGCITCAGSCHGTIDAQRASRRSAGPSRLGRSSPLCRSARVRRASRSDTDVRSFGRSVRLSPLTREPRNRRTGRDRAHRVGHGRSCARPARRPGDARRCVRDKYLLTRPPSFARQRPNVRREDHPVPRPTLITPADVSAGINSQLLAAGRSRRAHPTTSPSPASARKSRIRISSENARETRVTCHRATSAEPLSDCDRVRNKGKPGGSTTLRVTASR
jgi:hypothetical protein